jgi:hypothetical protein
MAAILSNRFSRRRTTPPLGSLEGRCSFIFLPCASSAGPGKPPYDLARSGLTVRCCQSPIVARIQPCRPGAPALTLSGPGRQTATRTESFRRVERHDQLSRTTIRLSPNPRFTGSVRHHRDYANAVPYHVGNWDVVSPERELGRVCYTSLAGPRPSRSWSDCSKVD